MISIISLALALTSTVSGLVPHSHNVARHIRHARKEQPNPQYGPGGFLEEYDGYHCRYLALECQNKHDTPFFDRCCHPLLATESVDKNRPDECQPPPKPCDHNTDVKTPFDGNYNQQKPKPDGDSPPEHKAKVDPPKAEGNNKSNDDKPKKADVGGGGNDNNGGDIIKGGFATFFFQAGGTGACGVKHVDGDLIAAMNVERYGPTGVHSPLCNKKVRITNTQNQKTVTVIIADACPGCKNANSIDLSTAAFKQIANSEEGMVPIDWSFV